MKGELLRNRERKGVRGGHGDGDRKRNAEHVWKEEAEAEEEGRMWGLAGSIGRDGDSRGRNCLTEALCNLKARNTVRVRL